ncbi:MAG: hypothetical protein KGQ67_00600 [Betaproteobacteria bacterium]|nr:hypothetical protein [Betaproteobacteria bacterium]
MVLVLCLALLLLGALGLHLSFAAGRAFTQRERLDAAADAAAYSAALWQARVLNYQALANRAIVAHEVAIAQAVTLASWARYIARFSQTASVLAAPWPPVAGVLAAVQDAAGVVTEITEQVAGEEVAVRSADSRLLAAGQEFLQLSVGGFAASAIANEIVRSADPRFFAFTLPLPGSVVPTRRLAGDDRARLFEVVRRSLDDFVLGPRGLDLPLYLLPSPCFGSPGAGWSAWFSALRKRGGTAMAPTLERWEAADTLSLHTHLPQRGWFGWFLGCRQAEVLPLAWGAAEAASPQTGLLAGDPGQVRENPAAAALAEQTLGASPIAGMSAYPGLPVVRELDQAALSDPRFPVARLAVLARAPAAVGRGAGRLALPSGESGGHVWSLASAEVFFRRPPGEPSRIEYASLFSPYWQARLVEPSAPERAVAAGYAR